ncbi:glycosyltransferase family 2 protein [Natronococcus occultus]|uniref:Putative glycosyltransferase n=1 Tax=Natronococcus occultus SP4 TaxID=694430 RepID=L0K4J9_9EURY|nr:glycosyltransferase [Natronococcus occultus]AGB39279.1 putative glycosyltransferase [Natronococcus occultus SP4]
MEMKTTVAVVTYDRPDHVDRLLSHLLRQRSNPDEVIVVNNGANDATRELVESQTKRFDRTSIALHHHPRSTDTSLQGGRNDAIRIANGDVICFVDDDVIPHETWLEGIERGYEWSTSAVAVGGPAPTTDEELTFQHPVVQSPTNQNHLNRFGEHRQITYKWIPPTPVETDFLIGANMSFEVDVLEEVGGFDPSYRGHPQFEELDVMAKLWKRGETIVYHPDALVYHLSASQGERDRVSYWYGRNSLRFRRQNFPETYRRSLMRLLIKPEFGPPVWRQLGGAILRDNTTYQWRLRGYIDELLLDQFDSRIGSRLTAGYAEE